MTAALNALDGYYIELRKALEPSRWHVISVTPEARRAAVGRRPTGENLIERLAVGISRAAEDEKDPEQKRRCWRSPGNSAVPSRRLPST